MKLLLTAVFLFLLTTNVTAQCDIPLTDTISFRLKYKDALLTSSMLPDNTILKRQLSKRVTVAADTAMVIDIYMREGDLLKVIEALGRRATFTSWELYNFYITRSKLKWTNRACFRARLQEYLARVEADKNALIISERTVIDEIKTED